MRRAEGPKSRGGRGGEPVSARSGALAHTDEKDFPELVAPTVRYRANAGGIPNAARAPHPGGEIPIASMEASN